MHILILEFNIVVSNTRSHGIFVLYTFLGWPTMPSCTEFVYATLDKILDRDGLIKKIDYSIILLYVISIFKYLIYIFYFQ